MPMAMKFDRNNSEKRKSAREQFEAKRNKWVVKGKPKWTTGCWSHAVDPRLVRDAARG